MGLEDQETGVAGMVLQHGQSGLDAPDSVSLAQVSDARRSI